MLLKVGELARHTGLTVRTLHHYDEIGLLTPSGRSESGYRLYSRDDVARLHGIQALRHLGLPLADIAGLLDGDGAAPGLILDQQIHALDQQVARASELRARLALMRDGLMIGLQPDMKDWLDTLGLMNTFGKYFSAAELRQIFMNWKSIEQEWLPLMERVRDAMRRGVATDSPEIQPLAQRWMSLMLHWMGGDIALIERWGAMYRQEPLAHGRNHAPPTDMMDYMSRAVELRGALFAKYLAPGDIQRIRFVPLADWQALEHTVLALLRADTPPGSPAAQAALAQWNALLDRNAGHDAALRARLQAARDSEPLLAAGSALSAPVRAYLQHIANKTLDPHAT